MKKLFLVLLFIPLFGASNKEADLDMQIQKAKERLKQYEINQDKIYPNSNYIESRFKDGQNNSPLFAIIGEESATQEKKLALSKMYSKADQKSGAYFSLLVGFGKFTDAYSDGRYSRLNNIPGLNGICDNTDKSGCSLSGVLKPSVGNDWNQNPDDLIITSNLFSFGGGFGYQKFFNEYFGSRIYGDGMLSFGAEKIKNDKVGDFYYILGGMNADLMLELPLYKFVPKQPIVRDFAFGIYAGISIGVMLLFDEANNNLKKYMARPELYKNGNSVLWDYLLQVDYGVNLGFSISYLNIHRIDLGAKIPMDRFGLPSSLRLGLENPASYGGIELVSKDIEFSRSPIYMISYIYLLK